MSTPATKTPILNPTSNGDWTVVLRRRRNGKQLKKNLNPNSDIRQTELSTPSQEPSSTWTPIDFEIDPNRESKLLQKMQSSIRTLESSKFYHRFLTQLRSAQIQDDLTRVLAAGSKMQMVIYGIGSIESYEPPRLQLSLAILLKRELDGIIGSVEVFDPILSSTECAVMEALGCTLIQVDERGRREAQSPTFFYMPHCEVELYDNLLEANWRPSMLNRMVLLGNSFGAYQRHLSEMTNKCRSMVVAKKARHLLEVRRYSTEVEIQITTEDDEGLFKAFQCTSWHFFDLHADTEMGLL